MNSIILSLMNQSKPELEHRTSNWNNWESHSAICDITDRIIGSLTIRLGVSEAELITQVKVDPKTYYNQANFEFDLARLLLWLYDIKHALITLTLRVVFTQGRKYFLPNWFLYSIRELDITIEYVE